MNNWYDKALLDLEKDVDSGNITQKEFQKCVRELNDELRSDAEEAAQASYNDTMGW